MLKVLHGVERLSAGQVTWSVPDINARGAQAYIFQKPFKLRRSVRQNLAFRLQLLKVEKSQIEWAHHSYLWGEQQKLALVRALIRAPQVLFLDEPCANLDGRSIRNLGQVRRFATDIVFLLNGHLHHQAETHAFFANPKTIETLALLKGDIIE